MHRSKSLLKPPRWELEPSFYDARGNFNRFETICKPTWGHLGTIWGLSWALLEATCTAPSPSSSPQDGNLSRHFTTRVRIYIHFEATCKPTWGHLGTIWGLSWALLDPSRAYFWASVITVISQSDITDITAAPYQSLIVRPQIWFGVTPVELPGAYVANIRKPAYWPRCLKGALARCLSELGRTGAAP